MGTLMELDPATEIHPGHSDADDGRARVGAQPVHPHLARPRPRGLAAVRRARRAGDADPARPRLRRRPQGLGALARRQPTTSSPAPRRAGRLRATRGRTSRGPREHPHLAGDALGDDRPARGRAGGAAVRHARREPRRAATTRADAALARRQVETAEQIVAVLGTMKGAAMKLGQVMSFLDVGLVPEEYREEFQRKLAELRDSAPKVSFKEMRKVIESEFDEPLDEIFARVRHRADRGRVDRPGLPRDAARRPRRSPSRCSTRASPARCARTSRTSA